MDVPGHGLTKPIWTDADFAQMGWHDSAIHGFHIDHDYDFDVNRYDFVFDLDYLTRWILIDDSHFMFWVAPATLAFHNAHTIEIDIDSIVGDIEVQELRRTESRLTPNGIMTEYLWVLDLQQGRISLWATGFTQYFRRWPIYKQGQWFTLEERGGLSFARTLDEPR